ncbi:MAG: hypothetical protein LIO75_04405 [Lachnospiraceae bacterium]|nr:hypothetical protein [Lachnospiraceae bacterium]
MPEAPASHPPDALRSSEQAAETPYAAAGQERFRKYGQQRHRMRRPARSGSGNTDSGSPKTGNIRYGITE